MRRYWCLCQGCGRKLLVITRNCQNKKCLARVLDMIDIESLLIDIGNYISSYFCLYCLYCATMVMPIFILICEILQYLTKPGYTYPSCLVRLEQCDTLLSLVSFWFVLHGQKWTTRIHAWFLITLVVIGLYNLLRNTSLQSVKWIFIFIENYICLKLPKTQRQHHAVRSGTQARKCPLVLTIFWIKQPYHHGVISVCFITWNAAQLSYTKVFGRS